MTDPLARRVHFVVGKGGVGKTTVAVALALIAQRAGRRVLVVEMEPGGGAGALLGMTEPTAYEARPSPAGVWVLAIDGRASLEEYLNLIVPVRRLLSAVFHSKIYQYFVAAAPGLKELMTVGKIWYEAERPQTEGHARWDTIVVDAPATGHSLQYLRMPRAARDTFGPGLVRREAERVVALLEDPAQTAVHLVATAEEMPVAETIEAYERLTGELRMPAGLLVVNRVHRGAFAPEALAALRAGAARLPRAEGRVAAEVAARAAEEAAWTALNRDHLDTLRRHVPLPVAVLPFVFAEEFGAAEVAALSELLEAQHATGRARGRRRSAP
jgi:anion-transporting  ArsA/GET3 family ATPase